MKRWAATFFVLPLCLLAACAPRVVPAGPTVATPEVRDDAFVAADGTTLPARTWAASEPTAIVLALHGFNDYSNAIEDFGRFAAARGITVYAYDQRGFGAAPHHGLWPGTETLTADLDAAATALRRRHPDLPLLVLGESMGGAVAIAALSAENPPPIDGAVLAAPAIWGRETMPWYQTAALWAAARTVPWLTLSGRRLNRQASDNIPMLRALGRDPLIITETRIDAIHGLIDLMDAGLAGTTRLRVPTLILYGARDEIIPAEPTRRAWARIPMAANQKLGLYPEGWHMLLRDLQAETVWRDILAWIHNPRAPLPSGADRDARRRLAALGVSGP